MRIALAKTVSAPDITKQIYGPSLGRTTGELVLHTGSQGLGSIYYSNFASLMTVGAGGELEYALGPTPTSYHHYSSVGAPSVPVVANDSCLLYTSPSPRDGLLSRMPSSA